MELGGSNKLNAPITRRDAPFQRGEVALLLIDMQRIWLEPGLDPAHASWNPDHYFYQETWNRIIPNQQCLLEAARNAGVEVMHTIIRSLTNDGRDRSLDHRLTPIHLPPGALEALPVPAVAPIGDEIVLPKTSSGVFNSTNLHYLLKNLGIRFLIVAGVLTDQCVDMAIRDGADHGYAIICVADACAAPTQDRHDAALRAFGGYCWVTDTVTVVTRLQALGRPAQISG